MMRCSPRTPVSISELEKPPSDDCCETGECEVDTEEVVPVVVQEEPEIVEEEPVEVEKVPEPEVVEEEPEQILESEPVDEPHVMSTPGSLMEHILLSEGVSDVVIRKYGIVEAFEGWYEGAADEESVRGSIQDFKAAQGGVINAKLSRIK